MESKEVIEKLRDEYKKAEADVNAAKKVFSAVKQKYGEALCPFVVGEHVTGFSKDGAHGIIESITLFGWDGWEAIIRPVKKDGTPSQTIRHVYDFAGKSMVRC